MNGALATYKQNSINTATQGQLIVMLYDGLLTALDKVEASLGAGGDIDVAHKELTRAQAIVSELHQSLDMSAGPVATSLSSLYEYCHRQLVAANLTKTFEPASPVRAVFTDLRSAWAEIVGQFDPIPA